MGICGRCGQKLLDSLRVAPRPTIQVIQRSRLSPRSPTLLTNAKQLGIQARSFSATSSFFAKTAPQEESSTHFGFETVSETEKTDKGTVAWLIPDLRIKISIYFLFCSPWRFWACSRHLRLDERCDECGHPSAMERSVCPNLIAVSWVKNPGCGRRNWWE